MQEKLEKIPLSGLVVIFYTIWGLLWVDPCNSEIQSWHQFYRNTSCYWLDILPTLAWLQIWKCLAKKFRQNARSWLDVLDSILSLIKTDLQCLLRKCQNRHFFHTKKDKLLLSFMDMPKVFFQKGPDMPLESGILEFSTINSSTTTRGLESPGLKCPITF